MASLSRFAPFGKLGYGLVSNLAQVPIIPQALYAIDLDDTVFSTKKVFDKGVYETHLNQKTKSRRGYHQEITTLHHSENAQWLKAISSCADLVYITMRSPELRQQTQDELVKFDLPLKPVYFSQHKGITFSEIVAERTGPAGHRRSYTDLVFVDDLDSNIREVLDYLPTCQCYRVDARLWVKLTARQRRKDAAIGEIVGKSMN